MINTSNIFKINEKLIYLYEKEFPKIEHPEYNNLKILDKLGEFERIIGLITELVSIDTNIKNLLIVNPSHGGFIGLETAKNFDSVFLCCVEEHHKINIQKNILTHNLGNKIFLINDYDINNKLLLNPQHNLFERNTIIYAEHMTSFIMDIRTMNSIIITKTNPTPFINDINHINLYELSNSEYKIYIPDFFSKKFTFHFKYYLTINNVTKHILNYNNLINLCIMVKNGGEQFKQMLENNMDIIDEWTILDTGSTDNTIQIINETLVGKKRGKLFQEEFINFRDSRNRLLELAGNNCKYKIMLDDTYIVKGNLRSFLNEIRGDQYANSFTLFIISEDTEYGSNRIIRSDSGLKYVHKIHEVITEKNNINVVIPKNRAYIEDCRFDYMEKRTFDRKQLDLKLLFEELEDDPMNPRTYYYLAQTYNLLEDYEKAFKYFIKRANFINAGFIQERIDAIFEAARIANFKLNMPWSECLKLYEEAYKIDESRPESLYFIGIHYYLEGNKAKAHNYFKKGFEIGFPSHCQYSLKPTLSYHFLPKFLTRTCYDVEDYLLGEKVSHFFLSNNKTTDSDYEEILSWYNIFLKLNSYNDPHVPNVPDKPIFCFIADGGFFPWSGKNIVTTGVGGSETYIIEMATNIQKSGLFDVIVFCNTPNEEDDQYENVKYMHLSKYAKFINTTYVSHCVVSRFSEYLPLTFKGWSENVYLVVHDLTPSGIVIPIDNKLKQIFCLSEWHVKYFTNIFPSLKDITVPFYYGCNFNKFSQPHAEGSEKILYSFIYSSFPNRGLLQLLQMWPQIYSIQPLARLHIYSDVNNKWSNQVEPEKMAMIKSLLEDYSKRENGLNIFYHGWVKKSDLEEAWKKSDIWFYPCTFMETFCLTALEAACSKTLAITSHLAALQNTVGDRGVIIQGDPTTLEWQENALKILEKYLCDVNLQNKKQLVERNYQWSLSLSWESQSKKFLDLYILPNKLEYKGMYNWTNDIPSGSRNTFLNVIDYFNTHYIKVKHNYKIKVLEIGSYTGISLINIVKRIPNSIGIGVDMWSNYDENELLKNTDNLKVKDSFFKNSVIEGIEDRIFGLQMNSRDALLDFVKKDELFDFIYVDGSHLLLDCYLDLFLSWQVLEVNGILGIDDYYYKQDSVLDSPFESVNHFLKVIEGKYKILTKDYRIFIEKMST
jgi:tetratricopeptide (TPR) repeat protein